MRISMRKLWENALPGDKNKNQCLVGSEGSWQTIGVIGVVFFGSDNLFVSVFSEFENDCREV